MDTRTRPAAELDTLPVPADRLYRMTPSVYRGMTEHDLIDTAQVGLEDGLLVLEEGDPSDPLDRLYRLPLDVYDRIAGLGLLNSDDKVEMIDGLLVNKMTKGDPHTTAIILIGDAIRGLSPKGWHIRGEAPIGLPDGPSGHAGVPEPDLTVVRGSARDYRSRKPSPADTFLVIEVAESSLRSDRMKLKRYAWSGIPVVWIMNLDERNIEIYSSPTGPREDAQYQDVMVLGEDDEIPLVIEGREVGRIPVREVLP